MSRPVRVPEFLAVPIMVAADAERRPFANMVTVLLEEALGARGGLAERDTRVVGGGQQEASVGPASPTTAGALRAEADQLSRSASSFGDV